jgi:hypothetical protein
MAKGYLTISRSLGAPQAGVPTYWVAFVGQDAGEHLKGAQPCRGEVVLGNFLRELGMMDEEITRILEEVRVFARATTGEIEISEKILSRYWPKA